MSAMHTPAPRSFRYFWAACARLLVVKDNLSWRDWSFLGSPSIPWQCMCRSDFWFDANELFLFFFFFTFSTLVFARGTLEFEINPSIFFPSNFIPFLLIIIFII
jgi:hypothetical protein